MQKQAQQFIELLDSQQLLAPEIIEELYRQVRESRTKLTPELLAKLLVDNGHLTKFQATKLVTQIRDNGAQDAESSEASESVDEELGFAPADNEQPDASAASNVAAVFVDDEDEPIDVAAGDVEEVNDGQEVADPVGLVDAVEVVEVVEAVEVSTPKKSKSAHADRKSTPPRSKAVVKRPAASAANPYDSFRVLGVGLALALVCVAGFFLVRHFWRGNAEKNLQRADDAYEQRSYDQAAKMYQEFADVFTTNENVSYARVRAALAAVRKDAEGAPDPVIGLTTAQAVLPQVANEPAMRDQQSDLAGSLVGLATKFNERADRTEETAARKDLMDQMGKLLEMIENPLFVGNAQRDQQAPTLLRIHEDRKRILREINRDEELASALQAIDEKLAAKDVLGAYQLRKELTRTYPLLLTNAGLMERVQKASEIQQSLVTTSSLNPKLSTAGIEPESGGRIVLANRSGGPAAELAGRIVYVKVKGSVYALDGETGEVRWRKFVGSDFKSDPVRLSPSKESDVMLCDPEQGLVSRLEGKSGEIVWSAELGHPVHVPVVEDEDLFVATYDGSLLSLDSVGGQTKWAIKLPQGVPASPGVARGKSNLYLPAEHSNLYVISRKDGSCQQVYYLDNQAGAIVVPPVVLLGQLFVFENGGSDSAQVRVFELDDAGLIVKESQTPFAVSGNIVVAPQIDGRRLVVLSDLGECIVLDIEPSAKTQKVSSLASVPKSNYRPQSSWLLTDSNKIWVADSRFTGFELQPALQKLKRAWIKNDGDTFTGPPQKFDDIIVHTRRLRGNRGVRVSAVQANTGEPVWENDLGVPVTLIAAPAPGKFDIVNSEGAYYAFDGQRLVNSPDTNPGDGKPSLDFSAPVVLSDGRTILFNRSKPGQLALYSPAGTKLKLFSANFGSGAPSSGAVAVGDNFAVGLDNGQFVVIDPNTGAHAASPYQVTLEPNQKVQWNTPVYLADSQTFVIASDQGQLVRLSAGDALRPLTEVTLENLLEGPLCVMGDQVCAVEASGAGDLLQFFDAASLKEGASLALLGRRVAGPFPIEDGCLVQTDSAIVCVNVDGTQRWKLDFSNSTLVAPPFTSEGQLVLATQAGGLWLVDPTQGDVLGSSDARQAFTSAPIAQSSGFLVGSDEGAVLALPIPTAPSVGGAASEGGL
ncbi:outer membrane protein assembly factor BamB family protein [Aureliella helgolandensis]|uniref:Outer membrane biogenesis protein BamB n=1 Tax=Aureliella helgolandensis TaxID=2527968 RepID=A0A518GFK6_9BACT|nr:PQQ-binding-like beta-propeller repeat protein [Aureliella helgolandensis]QDV27358.1 outer membrane biogenesis protein BamB [Aureliella helgolandensis]